ncbi:MAG: hypothetical protein ABL860_06725 [Candidatus Nitrotoga sp.]
MLAVFFNVTFVRIGTLLLIPCVQSAFNLSSGYVPGGRRVNKPLALLLSASLANAFGYRAHEIFAVRVAILGKFCPAQPVFSRPIRRNLFQPKLMGKE